MIVITPVRVMFFFSQLLYQTTDYFNIGDSRTDEFWIASMINWLSFQFGSFILVVFALITLAGWFEFFVLRRASLGLWVLEHLLFPLSFFFLPSKERVMDFDIEMTFFRLLPLAYL